MKTGLILIALLQYVVLFCDRISVLLINKRFNIIIIIVIQSVECFLYLLNTVRPSLLHPRGEHVEELWRQPFQDAGIVLVSQRLRQESDHITTVIQCSISEPEPVDPKLFEIWSRSRNYLFNKYVLQSVWRMQGWRKTSIETYFLWYRYYCYSTGLSGNMWRGLELEPEPK